MSWAIKIYGDEVDMLGLAQPTGRVHDITADGRLVVKIPGHSYWSGRGQQAYAGAELQVWQIQDTSVTLMSDGGLYLRADKLMDIPVSTPKDRDAMAARTLATVKRFVRQETHA